MQIQARGTASEVLSLSACMLMPCIWGHVSASQHDCMPASLFHLYVLPHIIAYFYFLSAIHSFLLTFFTSPSSPFSTSSPLPFLSTPPLSSPLDLSLLSSPPHLSTPLPSLFLRAHCITALMKLVAQNGSCPQAVYQLVCLYEHSASLDLHQR